MYNSIKQLFVKRIAVGLVVLGLACQAAAASRQEERRKQFPLEKLKARLEDPKVIQRKQPDRVIEAFGVRKGETVADIGAGTGMFSFRLARKVGAQGKIFAVEIEDELLQHIRERMAQEGVLNVETVKSSGSAPNLPRESCDKVLLVSTYEYFPDPVLFMKAIRIAMKPGGTVAIVSLDARKIPPKRESISKYKFYNPSEITQQMKLAGFVLRESHDFLKEYLFLIFEVAP